MRNIADVDAIRPRLAPGQSLVVIGGGYIGLELAAVAMKLGVGVTVLEQAPRLMARGVGPVASQSMPGCTVKKVSSSTPARWCAAWKASASFASMRNTTPTSSSLAQARCPMSSLPAKPG